MRARISSRTARYGEMAAAMAITEFLDKSSQTKPIRRMFSSRSSLLNPRPFERWVRTTSPSRTSTLAPVPRRRSARRCEMVLLPAPDIPVNQTVNPLCMFLGMRSISLRESRNDSFILQELVNAIDGGRFLDAQKTVRAYQLTGMLPQLSVKRTVDRSDDARVVWRSEYIGE